MSRDATDRRTAAAEVTCTATTRDLFLEDYAWLRSFGMSEERIAARLGLSRAALGKRLERAGVEGGVDAQVAGHLSGLIAGGGAVTAQDFPLAAEPAAVAAQIASAERGGRIVRVGSRRNVLVPSDSRLVVYRARPAETQQSA